MLLFLLSLLSTLTGHFVSYSVQLLVNAEGYFTFTVCNNCFILSYFYYLLDFILALFILIYFIMFYWFLTFLRHQAGEAPHILSHALLPMKIKHLTLRSSPGTQTGWRGEGDLLHWAEEYYQWATLVWRTAPIDVRGQRSTVASAVCRKRASESTTGPTPEQRCIQTLSGRFTGFLLRQTMMFLINWPLGLNNTLDFASPFGTSERWKVVCFEWRCWQNVCGAATLLFSFHLFEQVKRKTVNKWNM